MCHASLLSPHLSLYSGQCPQLRSHELQWRVWSSVSIARLIVATVMQWRRYVLRDLNGLPEESHHVRSLTRIHNTVEACGIVWLVAGSLWLLTARPYVACAREASPVYLIMVILLSTQYLEVCFPCCVAVVLMPVVCCCFPWFLRLVAECQDPMEGKGATFETIDTLPVVEYRGGERSEETDEGAADNTYETSCPICIGSFECGDSLRVLPCGHSFHMSCVDHWLVVNATCPNCRATLQGSHTGVGTGDSDPLPLPLNI